MNIRFNTYNISGRSANMQSFKKSKSLQNLSAINFTGKIDKTAKLLNNNKKILPKVSFAEKFKYYKSIILNKLSGIFTPKISKERAHQQVQTLFMRPDLSMEDSLRILNEYKELDKIKSPVKYNQAAFDMIKRNYGFSDDSTIELKYSYMRAAGAWDVFNGKVYLNVYMKRKDILAILHHELRHALQSFIAFSEKPNEFVKGIITKVQSLGSDKSLDNLCQEHCGKRFDTLMKTKKGQEKLEAAILKLSKTYYGSTPVKEFEGKEKFVDRVIEAEKNYVPSHMSKIKYFLNMVEVDAFNTERKILKLLKSKITD